mgnify:CR=1 FL=1
MPFFYILFVVSMIMVAIVADNVGEFLAGLLFVLMSIFYLLFAYMVYGVGQIINEDYRIEPPEDD